MPLIKEDVKTFTEADYYEGDCIDHKAVEVPRLLEILKELEDAAKTNTPRGWVSIKRVKKALGGIL